MAKKDEKQQMHIMRAIEKSPSLFPVGEALGLRSRTNDISASSSTALMLEAQADGGLELFSLNSCAIGLLCCVICSPFRTEPDERLWVILA